jgi:alpha-D-ribose 1-methylphosphonate 5-triphosphate synthase subunit PhnG
LENLINPLAALQQEQHQQRAQEIAASRVDFFTLVRGDN